MHTCNDALEIAVRKRTVNITTPLNGQTPHQDGMNGKGSRDRSIEPSILENSQWRRCFKANKYIEIYPGQTIVPAVVELLLSWLVHGGSCHWVVHACRGRDVRWGAEASCCSLLLLH